jgi:hypothetical protein
MGGHRQRSGSRATVVALAVSLVLALFPVGAMADDSYSSYHHVRDSAGQAFWTQAMVRNQPYGDHIYVENFWLQIDVTDSSVTTRCGHFPWSRMSPSPLPYTGTLWTNGWPFPLNYWNTPAWSYVDFYQDMYWNGDNNPTSSQHRSASEDVCGSGSSWRTAGVQMYRFPTYWYEAVRTR